LLQSNPQGRTIARLFVMGGTNAQLPIGQQVSLPGHFDLPVTLESARIRLPEFLTDAQPSLEQLRLVCQALAGPAPKGGELADISADAEQSALGKPLANWSAVMECQQVKADSQKGQKRFL